MLPRIAASVPLHASPYRLAFKRFKHIYSSFELNATIWCWFIHGCRALGFLALI
jgi:hypothetical protein